MHYENQANIVFYILAAISIIVMLAGILGMVRVWRLGKTPTLNTDIKVSKWLRSILKASFLETQILEYGFLAWVTHLMIFWGFVALFLLTTFHFALNWVVPHSSSFFHYFSKGNGNLLLALWGDLGGVILLIGILVALFRRYVIRPKTLNTISDDSVAIWFLFVLTLTGFMCEVVRLAGQPEAHDSSYSFAVNWLVPFLRQYAWIEAGKTYMFWIHSILSFFFLIYIPFSKFKHIFASPLDFAFVTAGIRYSKEKWLKR
jgi:nitrate reductase gamma subunit